MKQDKIKPATEGVSKANPSPEEIVGKTTPARRRHLLEQLGAAMQPGEESVTGSIQKMGVALDALAGFAPRDENERMLVTQMIAAHEAAMECFARAMLPGQTLEGRDMNLKHAERLSSIYARQVEALDKHRGKGKQKITVEHVNVHAGGQAIVGDVNAAKAGAPPAAGEAREAPALTDESAATGDGEELRKALNAKKAPAVKRPRK